MLGLLIRFVVSALALGLTSRLVHGFHAEGLWGLVQAAFVLGILNALIRPLILLLTLPVNLLTLGLFTFVINALLLKMASAAIPGFDVIGFWPAVWGSLLISVVAGLLNTFIGERMPPRTPGPGRDDAAKVINLENKGDNRWE